MVVAGLVVEGLFSGAGLIPMHRSTTIAPTHFSWNHTTVMNVVFLAWFGALYWLYRNRARLGGGAGLAMDPVCGMQVRTVDAPARSSFAGQTVWFCSDHCRERFDAEPPRYASQPATSDDAQAIGELHPVCGMTVDPEKRTTIVGRPAGITRSAWTRTRRQVTRSVSYLLERTEHQGVY